MGGDNSQPDLDLLQINFIQYFDDENFGFVKIYREIHSPYDFFMLLELTYHGVYTSLPPQVDELRVLCTAKYRHVAEVIWINEAEQQRSLCTSPKVKILQRYYNITLKYLKKSRFERGQIFNQGEIWYLILAIQTTHKQLASHNIHIPDFGLSQIFLNTKGEVFFYPNIKFLSCGDYHQDLNLDCYEHQPRLSLVKGRKLTELIQELISPQNSQTYYPNMKTLYSNQLVSFLNSYNEKSSAQEFVRKHPTVKPDSYFDLGRERQQDGFRIRVYQKLSKHGPKQSTRGSGGWNMGKVRDFQQVRK